MDKAEWQRQQRRAFKIEHGYSTHAHFATGGLREAVLIRDGRKCVGCGMTEAQHLERWQRPITVDHKDKDRRHNTLDNLQTLCLSCHGRKDLIPSLRVQKVPEHKDRILAMRAAGVSYQEIATATGFSIAIIHRWCQRWGVKRQKRSRYLKEIA